MKDSPKDTLNESETAIDGQLSTVSSLPVKSESSEPATSRKKPDGPLTARDVQEMAFKAAGTDRKEVAALVVKKTLGLMDAEHKKTVVTRDGRVIESTRPDNSTQLGASKQAGEIVGLFSSRASEAPSKASVTIELILPEWARVRDIQ